MSSKTKKLKKKSVTTKTIKYDILRIDWNDHNTGNHAWKTKEELVHKPLHCVSVGINVKEDKEGVTLCQNMGDNMDLADTIYILKSCITYRAKLGTVQYAKET